MRYCWLLTVVCLTAGCNSVGYSQADLSAATPAAGLSSQPLDVADDWPDIQVPIGLLPGGSAVQLGQVPCSSHEALTAEECLCLAVRHSVLGDTLELERRLVASTRSGRLHAGKSEANSVSTEILTWRQAEQRNAAGLATLLAFYRLAEVDYGLTGIDRSLREVSVMGQDLQALIAGGLAGNVDPKDAHIRELQLLKEREDLLASRAQLQSQLNTLTGLSDCSPACQPPCISPRVSLEVSETPIDCDQAVREALCHRAELAILRSLSATAVDDRTIGVARDVLRGESSSLALKTPPSHPLVLLLGSARLAQEAETRRAQVQRLRRDRQTAITNEVVAAVDRVASRKREVGVSAELLASRRERLQRMTRKRQLDGVTGLDLAIARLEIIRTEMDLISAVIDVRVAETELRAAQGLLVFDCCGPSAP